MPTTGDAPAAQYPRRLIALSPARRRFGSAVDVIGTMLRVGDPLADAAVIDLAGDRVPPAVVTALLEGRSASVAVPDSLTALVAELERLPVGCDRSGSSGAALPTWASGPSGCSCARAELAV
jgi:hypothetical protein